MTIDGQQSQWMKCCDTAVDSATSIASSYDFKSVLVGRIRTKMGPYLTYGLLVIAQFYHRLAVLRVKIVDLKPFPGSMKRACPRLRIFFDH